MSSGRYLVRVVRLGTSVTWSRWYTPMLFTIRYATNNPVACIFALFNMHNDGSQSLESGVWFVTISIGVAGYVCFPNTSSAWKPISKIRYTCNKVS